LHTKFLSKDLKGKECVQEQEICGLKNLGGWVQVMQVTGCGENCNEPTCSIKDGIE
jgi:hypothetical protein